MTQSQIIHIDIFSSVIDYLGDIGFLTELMMDFERKYPGKFYFHVYTDNIPSVIEYFTRNQDYLPLHSLSQVSEYSEQITSGILFLLLHYPIPSLSQEKKYLVFRIDYLSFDADWTQNNGKEHILSTDNHRILEIIPSFLPSGVGLVEPQIDNALTREEFLKKFSWKNELIDKKWVTIFVYDDVYDILDLENIPEDMIVFVCGKNLPEYKNTLQVPFLNIVDFQTLLHLSDLCVVRGEVSSTATLILGKPILWDMYKGIGGFVKEQSEGFLDFFGYGEGYSELHRNFNTRDKRYSLEQIYDIVSHEKSFSSENTTREYLSLVDGLKKYIDRFYFSL